MRRAILNGGFWVAFVKWNPKHKNNLTGWKTRIKTRKLGFHNYLPITCLTQKEGNNGEKIMWFSSDKDYYHNDCMSEFRIPER